jgi:hypothetical protein
MRFLMSSTLVWNDKISFVNPREKAFGDRIEIQNE